jgi:hypothetical protein
VSIHLSAQCGTEVDAQVLIASLSLFSLASNKNDKYWSDYNSLKVSLEQFQMTLPYIGYEAWRTQAPFLDVELLTVHTLVHVSVIHLQQELIEMSIYQAANSVLALIRQLTDADYEFLDPIMSVSIFASTLNLIDRYNVIYLRSTAGCL